MGFQKNIPGRRLFAAILAGLAMAAVLAAAFWFQKGREEPTTGIGGGHIGYDQGATVLDKEDTVPSLTDQPSSGGVTLSYRNNAYSTDGNHFNCYIANSPVNQYDFYLDIYANPEYTDRIFLSGLVRPGFVFEEIQLTRPLEVGDHTVYVVVTQVEEADGQQKIHAQVSHTMEFHVTGE